MNDFFGSLDDDYEVVSCEYIHTPDEQRPDLQYSSMVVYKLVEHGTISEDY